MDGPIVVGTDGSETAAIAVVEAIRLAQAFKKPLHIVTAYRPAALEVRGLPSEFGDSVRTTGVTSAWAIMPGSPMLVARRSGMPVVATSAATSAASRS